MRNLVKLMPLLLFVFSFSSCLKDDDYSLSKFWVSAATINTEDVKPYVVVTDNGDRLFPSSSNINVKPKNGQRVWVSYTILGDSEDRFDYYVKINDVREILTKGITTLTDSNKDSIGNDPVEVESVWFSGDYLTVGFAYGGGGAIHFINLVRNDADAFTNEGLPIFELRHNRNKDRYNNAMRGWVSFDLSELKDSSKDSVSFILRAKPFDDQEPFEKKLIYKYGASQ